MKIGAGTVVPALLLAACNAPERHASDVKTFDISIYNEQAERDCGGEQSPVPVRSCGRFDSSRRYRGLYFRHLEGSSFVEGARPNVPFAAEAQDAYIIPKFDSATEDADRLPDLRRSDKFPVDTNFIKFIGRRRLGGSSNPAQFGAEPLILVDRLIVAHRVDNRAVVRRMKDGSVLRGW